MEADSEGERKGRETMVYTGLFFVKDVSGKYDGHTGVLCGVTSVTAICLTCRSSFNAMQPPDLEILQGGALLYCRTCGARQVITNENFQDVLTR